MHGLHIDGSAVIEMPSREYVVYLRCAVDARLRRDASASILYIYVIYIMAMYIYIYIHVVCMYIYIHGVCSMRYAVWTA